MARLRIRLPRDQIDQLIGELGHIHQLGPWPCEARPELREEMAHPRLAARDAIGLEQAHLRPAQAKPHADRLIDFFGRGDAVLDQPQRLAPDGLEETIGDMGVDLLAHQKRIHADAAQDFSGLFASGRIAHQFDQRQKIDRVERVRDHGTRAFFVQFRWLEARC